MVKYIKLILIIFSFTVIHSPAFAGKPIFKQRGPLDSTRQFYSHFKFSTLRPIKDVRQCVLGKVESDDKIDYKIKKYKKNNVNFEKYEFGKYKKTIIFSYTDQWTHVDTDMVYGIYSSSLEKVSRELSLYRECAKTDVVSNYPVDMPRLITYPEEEEPVLYTKITNNTIDVVMNCLMKRIDWEDASYNAILSADPDGMFYLSYGKHYHHLGPMQIASFLIRVTTPEEGVKLEVLSPGGKKIGEPDIEKMKLRYFPVIRIDKCTSDAVT